MVDFKVGDRVRDKRFSHVFYGTILHICSDDTLVVQDDDGNNYGVPAYLMQKA